MELMAVVEGLKLLTRDGLDIIIYSDSSYVVNSVEKGWVFDWVKKGFKDKKNPDLWKEFLQYYKRHRIKFIWVKGHADNPWNNRCDQLATAAADSRRWLVDEGYEREKNSGFL
ncbi:MAG: ribonuclease, partial [Flavipsychrobacter sp.]|nr:ribonuclease [Flavipsychrobacter sp.]